MSKQKTGKHSKNSPKKKQLRKSPETTQEEFQETFDVDAQGSEESEVEETVGQTVDNAEFQENLQSTSSATVDEESSQISENSDDGDRKKVHLDFYGSEILRSKAPQAFELAEAVAEEWVNDGNFQKLPLNSPLAQLVAAVGLQSAKRIEKKLEEKGVITIARFGLDAARKKLFKADKNESV